MTTSVTMLTNVQGGLGVGLLLSGSTYALEDTFANRLVYEKRAILATGYNNQPNGGEPMLAYYRGPWAGRPAASALPVGAQIIITDVGGAASRWYTDGAFWRPVNNSILLAQSAVPSILLPAATAITATGAITGLVALPYDPTALGVVPVYMFLGSLGGVNGLYYARFSSATACQLYTDAAGTVQPSGLTAGAYAPTTSLAPLASITVPDSCMGLNGALRISTISSYPNNANAKITRITLGATTLQNASATTTVSYSMSRTVRNRASQAMQLSAASTAAASGDGSGTSTASPNITTVDTSQAQTLAINGALAAGGLATDYLILEGYTVELLN